QAARQMVTQAQHLSQSAPHNMPAARPSFGSSSNSVPRSFSPSPGTSTAAHRQVPHSSTPSFQAPSTNFNGTGRPSFSAAPSGAFCGNRSPAPVDRNLSPRNSGNFRGNLSPAQSGGSHGSFSPGGSSGFRGSGSPAPVHGNFSSGNSGNFRGN